MLFDIWSVEPTGLTAQVLMTSLEEQNELSIVWLFCMPKSPVDISMPLHTASHYIGLLFWPPQKQYRGTLSVQAFCVLHAHIR